MKPFKLNDLTLPPNHFNILAAMAVVSPTTQQQNIRENPQLPVPSKTSSNSKPPMKKLLWTFGRHLLKWALSIQMMSPEESRGHQSLSYRHHQESRNETVA